MCRQSTGRKNGFLWLANLEQRRRKDRTCLIHCNHVCFKANLVFGTVFTKAAKTVKLKPNLLGFCQVFDICKGTFVPHTVG